MVCLHSSLLSAHSPLSAMPRKSLNQCMLCDLEYHQRRASATREAPARPVARSWTNARATLVQPLICTPLSPILLEPHLYGKLCKQENLALATLALHEDVVHTVCAMRYDWQVCCAGYIKLWLPVFHIGYWKPMMSTLQCICKSCSSILLPEEEFRVYLKRMRSASDITSPSLQHRQPCACTDKVL